MLSVWVPARGAAAPAPRAAAPAPRRRRAPDPPRRPTLAFRARARLHMAMIRVLLVDDNAIVRRGIASLLAEADGIEVVGEAADGREAIARARESCAPTSSAWTCGCR